MKLTTKIERDGGKWVEFSTVIPPEVYLRAETLDALIREILDKQNYQIREAIERSN